MKSGDKQRSAILIREVERQLPDSWLDIKKGGGHPFSFETDRVVTGSHSNQKRGESDHPLLSEAE